MPHSHHSRRLSLKKASHKKGLMGHDNHASLFLSLCVWNVFGSQRSGGYIRRNLPSCCEVGKLTISCVLQVGLLNLTRKWLIDVDVWDWLVREDKLHCSNVGTSRIGEEEGICIIHKFLPFIQQLWHSITIHPNSCCIVKLFHAVMKSCIYLRETICTEGHWWM